MIHGQQNIKFTDYYFVFLINFISCSDYYEFFVGEPLGSHCMPKVACY
jgi:hypothetical protein